ncbi:MAG TPA: methionyl-tRNA formyltransferase [Oscillospiraceae bacterium]|nr:methionyl-tRNA formyltransferase [Oscillospiraceae bacterium]
MAKTTLVFMGTPEFAVPSLQALAGSFHILAVVTQPDRRAGRGRKMQSPAVKKAALALEMPVVQPEDLRQADFAAWLAGLQPDYLVTCAYGKILPLALLALPRLGALNVHASLLPYYRGSAPIHRAIMNGDQESGITIMHMDQGMDTGDMILQQALPITAADTTGSLHHKLADLGAKLVVEAIIAINNGQAQRRIQDNQLATYAPPLTREDEQIDWCQSSQVIHNQVRGMNPWPGAYTELNDQRLKIWEGRPVAKHGNPCGAVLAVDQEGLLVATGDGAYLITKLQPPGKKTMLAADFLRGHHLALGTILS